MEEKVWCNQCNAAEPARYVCPKAVAHAEAVADVNAAGGPVEAAIRSIEERAAAGDRHGSPTEKARAEGMREAVRTIRAWQAAVKS